MFFIGIAIHINQLIIYFVYHLKLSQLIMEFWREEQNHYFLS